MKIERLREDFPILKEGIIYFDNACMSLKPRQVIEKMNEYYLKYPSCALRSHHRLSNKASEEYENARGKLRKFINAKKNEEIIFTKNTTESINLVSHTLNLNKGDVVLTTDKEHNSNNIPWQVLSKKGIIKQVIDSKPDNTFDIEKFENMMNKNVKLVSVVHSSNLDGVENPIKEITKIAHDYNALVLIDAAQSIPHKPVDVNKLNVDFLAFSGHKMLGPTGTGVLYGKKELLEKLDLFITGGETVIESTFDTFEKENLPQRFEAGLQNYSGFIGLGEAVEYLNKLGLDNIKEHEKNLNKILTKELINTVDIIGPKDPELRGGIFSFNVPGLDPHNVAIILDQTKKIAVRSGAHCVHSWFNKHNMKGSVRASLYLYNTEEECKIFAEEVNRIAKYLK